MKVILMFMMRGTTFTHVAKAVILVMAGYDE